MELIIEDKYDFIVVYTGNYDSFIHKYDPEATETLAELRTNARIFGIFNFLIQNVWKNHSTLVGFGMDRGCHEIDGGAGSHGLDMDEDINIRHFYKINPEQI